MLQFEPTFLSQLGNDQMTASDLTLSLMADVLELMSLSAGGGHPWEETCRLLPQGI